MYRYIRWMYRYIGQISENFKGLLMDSKLGLSSKLNQNSISMMEWTPKTQENILKRKNWEDYLGLKIKKLKEIETHFESYYSSSSSLEIYKPMYRYMNLHVSIHGKNRLSVSIHSRTCIDWNLIKTDQNELSMLM